MLTVHQYQSPPAGFLVNSWLIEMERTIVLIDCQFLVSEATALTKKIASLAKPLEAVIITHPHPDHFNGTAIIAEAFPDVRLIATQRTTDIMHAIDEPKRAYWTPTYKAEYPSSIRFPTETLASKSSVTISGIEFSIEDIGAGECDNLSMIHLPQERMLFSSDLIYHHVHPWLAEGRSNAWILQMAEALSTYSQVKRVFPGHGDETTLAGLNIMTGYISRFQELVRTHGDDEVQRRMLEEFPSYPLADLLPHNIRAVRQELG